MHLWEHLQIDKPLFSKIYKLLLLSEQFIVIESDSLIIKSVEKYTSVVVVLGVSNAIY